MIVFVKNLFYCSAFHPCVAITADLLYSFLYKPQFIFKGGKILKHLIRHKVEIWNFRLRLQLLFCY